MFWKTVKILRDFAEENWRKSKEKLIIAGECLPSENLSLVTKIILITFTTANDSPNLVHFLLMAFRDLEKQKHDNFLEKHYAGKKPYGASSTASWWNKSVISMNLAFRPFSYQKRTKTMNANLPFASVPNHTNSSRFKQEQPRSEHSCTTSMANIIKNQIVNECNEADDHPKRSNCTKRTFALSMANTQQIMLFMRVTLICKAKTSVSRSTTSTWQGTNLKRYTTLFERPKAYARHCPFKTRLGVKRFTHGIRP